MRSGLHSLRLGSSHMVPWLEPDPETASTPGTQRQSSVEMARQWFMDDLQILILSDSPASYPRVRGAAWWHSWLWSSLLCTWAWPGLGSALEAAASGHELGCPLAPAVMAWTWAQSQLRLRAQSHDTRARAHWPGLLTGIMCLLALTTGTQALCANMC